MTATFDERVMDYVCGALEGEALQAFEAELRTSQVLRQMVGEAEELLAHTAAALPPVSPSPELRERVLAAVVPAPWKRALERVARVWDLTVAEVERTLARAMDPETWEPGPVPGVTLFHLVGGPTTVGADVGLVRFPPGLAFPHHGHGGGETYVVLEGEVRDSSGRVEAVGDLIENGPELEHSFVVGPEGCVFAITLHGGLKFPGAPAV